MFFSSLLKKIFVNESCKAANNIQSKVVYSPAHRSKLPQLLYRVSKIAYAQNTNIAETRGLTGVTEKVMSYKLVKLFHKKSQNRGNTTSNCEGIEMLNSEKVGSK
jgi:hypothetical protein